MTTATAQSRLASINPATGLTVGEVTVTPVESIAAMVRIARDAQPAWAALAPAERGRRLEAAGADLARDADTLGELMTQEMGKPLAEAVGEVRHCGEGMTEKVRDIAPALVPDTLEDDRVVSTVFHDPFGVCVAITPWNFPLAMPHSLVIPALMAGNTVILKPSEETPLVAQAYIDRLTRHLPSGVLQIAHGAESQGRALVAADVDLIAFTGSREVGQAILGEASRGLKRVILELGGKDPMIVLADADLDDAAEFAARNSFRNAGQVCVSTERIYVDQRVAADFEAKVAAIADAQQVGNGLDPATTIGPMVHPRQRDHVVAQIQAAVDAGAEMVTGSRMAEGNFIRPTVLTGVTHEMGIMREETFGPVACIMRVSGPDEAVACANDTRFGLGAAVFGSGESATSVARRLTAGMIGVNKSCGGASGTPWVGARESGYGFHGGREGHHQFTQTRVVSHEKGRRG